MAINVRQRTVAATAATGIKISLFVRPLVFEYLIANWMTRGRSSRREVVVVLALALPDWLLLRVRLSREEVAYIDDDGCILHFKLFILFFIFLWYIIRGDII